MKWLHPNLSTLGMALLLSLLTWALLTDVPSSDGPVSAGWLSCLCTVHAASTASDAANVIVNERLAI